MSGCDWLALTAEDDHKNEIRKCSVRAETKAGYSGY